MRFFILIALLLIQTSCLVNSVGGKFKPQNTPYSKQTRAMLDTLFQNISQDSLRDYHTHLVAIGTQVDKAYANPHFFTWKSPIKRFKFSIYKSASGIENNDSFDKEYFLRLLTLARSTGGKYNLLAFDKFYHPNGEVDLEKTEFYIPNEHVVNISMLHPELFVPTISVHPYRKDALIELEKWAKQGVKMVKWLPNAMGIDPSDDRIIPFYNMMKTYNMVLLSHVGEEQAVEAEEYQKLGNPLLFRKPLDMGVKVVMAHAASLGTSIDFETEGNPVRSTFDLFLRLIDEPKYQGLLFGELSAITLFNRDPHILKVLLSRKDLHKRLINGSDYPLPAINFLIRTGEFADDNFITENEKVALNEIYSINPLLFDLALKILLKHPETGAKFSSSIFTRSKI